MLSSPTLTDQLQAFEFGATELFDVEFHGLLPLSSERPVPVEVKLEGTRWSVNSASYADYTKTWPIQVNNGSTSVRNNS